MPSLPLLLFQSLQNILLELHKSTFVTGKDLSII